MAFSRNHGRRRGPTLHLRADARTTRPGRFRSRRGACYSYRWVGARESELWVRAGKWRGGTGCGAQAADRAALNVILLDDDDHTYEYVIEMLCKLFGHSQEIAYRMACEVDATGG